jgi:hypothetical protein
LGVTFFAAAFGSAAAATAPPFPSRRLPSLVASMARVHWSRRSMLEAHRAD